MSNIQKILIPICFFIAVIVAFMTGEGYTFTHSDQYQGFVYSPYIRNILNEECAGTPTRPYIAQYIQGDTDSNEDCQ